MDFAGNRTAGLRANGNRMESDDCLVVTRNHSIHRQPKLQEGCERNSQIDRSIAVDARHAEDDGRPFAQRESADNEETSTEIAIAANKAENASAFGQEREKKVNKCFASGHADRNK